MTTDSNPNPQPGVETPPPPPPNPQPQPQGDSQRSSTQPSFDADGFFSKLEEKLTGFGEQMVTGIREAFPAPAPPPPPTPPPGDAPKGDAPKGDAPKGNAKPDEPPAPGKKTFAQWWFGQ